MCDRALAGAIPLVLMLLASCGGGASAPEGTAPPPGLVTEIVPSVAQSTGYVVPPAVLEAPATPAVGDNGDDRPQRGFFRFDLTGLPAGIEVESALLQVYQSALQGDPYDTLGPLFVEDVNLGLTLDPDDYGALVPSSAIGILSEDPTIGLKTLDVTEKVRRDVRLGREGSDYRLFFNIATDLDGQPDRAFLEAGAGGPASGLVITYRR